MFKSSPVVASNAPLGDHAAAVKSPFWPLLKDFWLVQSLRETTWIAVACQQMDQVCVAICILFVGVGAAKALPSGCQMILALDCESVSTILIKPSSFLTSCGSSELNEYM